MNELMHSGTMGMRWYHRFHQSYKTKPTRSGKIGQEHFVRSAGRKPATQIFSTLMNKHKAKKLAKIAKEKEEADAKFKKQVEDLKARKEQIMKQGTAEEALALHAVDPMSTDDLNKIKNRIDAENSLKNLIPKPAQRKSTLDELLDKGDKINRVVNKTSNYINTGINMYNTLVKIYNTTQEGRLNPMPLVSQNDPTLQNKNKNKDKKEGD